MILTHSKHLNPNLKEQYEVLLKEADSEPLLYGIPLDPKTPRIILHQDGIVVGIFEPTLYEYKGVTYFRTNRPYTKKAARGKGYMDTALQHWYQSRQPGWAWIDNANVKSIALFTRLGFVKEDALVHKEKDGFVYLLK